MNGFLTKPSVFVTWALGDGQQDNKALCLFIDLIQKLFVTAVGFFRSKINFIFSDFAQTLCCKDYSTGE